MFEHVGAAHYREYFTKLAALLKDDGVALIHTIGGVAAPDAPQPWMSKYIFPGGYIPSLSEIAPAVEKAGLVVTDIEVLRLHYAETLKAWRQRFMARRADAAALYDERFVRIRPGPRGADFFVSERFQACVFRLDPLTSCREVVRKLPETCRWVADASSATLVAEATGF